MFHSRRSLCCTVPLSMLAWSIFAAFPLDNRIHAAEPALTFERDIRGIFRTHCYDCHGATETLEGSLDLRLVRFMEKGGDSGAAVVRGKPEESLLIERIRKGEMPPGQAKVSAEELKKLETWVAAGAPTARPEPETIGPGLPILPEERDWWSFHPLGRPAVPQPVDASRIRTPVDAFLQAAMPNGLEFSADADWRQQVLRACFDLTGLPPSDEQLQRFLAAPSESAYEQLIDELLASPHYGERWGRHWLDVAGYADSEGRTTKDAPRDWAYKYRDYVIRSFNTNKPFDRFLHEQLAGDELAGVKQGDWTAEQVELLTATGFLRMAADGTGSGDNSEEARNFVVSDTLQIVSTSLLGLTVACAQCHDHRYDPISHTDYFALRAVFEPALNWKAWKTPQQRDVSLYTQADRDEAARIETEAQAVLKEKGEKLALYMAEALEKELTKYEEPLRTNLNAAYQVPVKDRTEEQKALLSKHPSINITSGNLYQYNQAHADDLKKYDERAAEIRAKKPVEEFIRALTETAGKVPETHLFYRGDYRQPKQVVAPAAPTVLSPENQMVSFDEKPAEIPTSGRRTAFAQWLTSTENPITSRVLVNRIWLHHFGRGLVETPADFGKMGARPTHPELLDWLAREFMESGWDLKKFHRLVVLSTAYRQSSHRDPHRTELDDSNHYYWRQNIVRLDAEVLRDRVLAVTGQLDGAQYGPPVPVKEDKDGQAVVDGTSQRRSLYIQQRRSQPISMLQAFDAPVMTINCEKRPSSTVATQSLMLMNSPFALTQSQALAQRVLAQPAALSAKEKQNLPAILPPPEPSWRYGYGSYDDAGTGPVAFTPFAHYEKGRWSVGKVVPDPKIGWAVLSAAGGHAGNTIQTSPIRRWSVPASGTVSLTGTLKHPSPNGNGVRGRVLSSRSGKRGEWIAEHQSTETKLDTFPVEAGEIIDLITDCRGDVNSDSFEWEVSLTLTLPDGDVITTNTRTAFAGPTAQSTPLVPENIARAWSLAYCRQPTTEELQLAIDFLNRQLTEMTVRPRELPAEVSASQQALANLCQALLTSNEFLYVE